MEGGAALTAQWTRGQRQWNGARVCVAGQRPLLRVVAALLLLVSTRLRPALGYVEQQPLTGGCRGVNEFRCAACEGGSGARVLGTGEWAEVHRAQCTCHWPATQRRLRFEPRASLLICLIDGISPLPVECHQSALGACRVVESFMQHSLSLSLFKRQ